MEICSPHRENSPYGTDRALHIEDDLHGENILHSKTDNERRGNVRSRTRHMYITSWVANLPKKFHMPPTRPVLIFVDRK